MRVNRPAVKQMNTEKRNQVAVIPLTDDLQKFREYILTNIADLSQSLRRTGRPADWLLLAKFTMSRLILFNKEGELK